MVSRATDVIASGMGRAEQPLTPSASDFEAPQPPQAASAGAAIRVRAVISCGPPQPRRCLRSNGSAVGGAPAVQLLQARQPCGVGVAASADGARMISSRDTRTRPSPSSALSSEADYLAPYPRSAGRLAIAANPPVLSAVVVASDVLTVDENSQLRFNGSARPAMIVVPSGSRRNSSNVGALPANSETSGVGLASVCSGWAATGRLHVCGAIWLIRSSWRAAPFSSRPPPVQTRDRHPSASATSHPAARDRRRPLFPPRDLPYILLMQKRSRYVRDDHRPR